MDDDSFLNLEFDVFCKFLLTQPGWKVTQGCELPGWKAAGNLRNRKVITCITNRRSDHDDGYHWHVWEDTQVDSLESFC